MIKIMAMTLFSFFITIFLATATFSEQKTADKKIKPAESAKVKSTVQKEIFKKCMISKFMHQKPEAQIPETNKLEYDFRILTSHDDEAKLRYNIDDNFLHKCPNKIRAGSSYILWLQSNFKEVEEDNEICVYVNTLPIPVVVSGKIHNFLQTVVIRCTLK